MHSFFTNLRSRLQEHTERIEHQFVPAGIIFLIGYLGFYFLWSAFGQADYESFLLRLVAATLTLPFIFKNLWPRKYYFLLGVLWYLMLLYLIPFFFTFMLLKSNASTTSQLNLMVGVTVLAILMDWKQAVVIFFAGLLIALAVYGYSTGHLFWTNRLIGIIVNEMCIIIFVRFFTSKKIRIQESRLQTIKLVSADMAHELRTPLRTIASNSGGLKKYLPALFDGYEKAKAANLDVLPIPTVHYRVLQHSLENIESEVHSAFTVINMLMVVAGMAKAQIDQEPIKTCSAKKCIETALERYPFDRKMKELVHWPAVESELKDFNFICKELLIVHVLFNLFKNALYHIKKANKGEIFIWLESDGKNNFIHFKDTGPGIPEKVLSHIFEQFYSNTLHGSGIGLAFCKRAMKSMHGDIKCFSQEGEFTEFVLVFPFLQ
jgi:signal transduction histidine kinase